MAYPTHNTQHVATGLSRLVSRYKGLPNITKLLTAYLLEVQAAEDMLWDVLSLRNIASGVGDQLDQIGKIVGQPREGLDDPSYRISISLRVLANSSKGRTTDILKIALTLAQNFTSDLNGLVDYHEAPSMNFSVGVWDQTEPALAASLLHEAKAASSRGVLLYTTWPDGDDFSFGSLLDPTAGEAGWGSVSDPAAGGLLIAEIGL